MVVTHWKLVGALDLEKSRSPRCSLPCGVGPACGERQIEGPTFRSRSAWFCTSSLYFSLSLLYRCSLAWAFPVAKDQGEKPTWLGPSTPLPINQNP